jgi:PIN domain nuclease of toxin-antitoxin system
MKYLLDTMVWLWSVGPSEKIGPPGLEILSSGSAEIYLSAASSWEIAIKVKLGTFRLPEAPGPYVRSRLAKQGIHPLSIAQDHALRVYDLPLHHADPFDRLIIAQAIDEEMTILTSDRAFAKYSVEVVWCGK